MIKRLIFDIDDTLITWKSEYNNAINKALDDVANKDTGEIPMHIRNAPVEGMQDFGYSVGYKYPHDFPGHIVEQQYLPDKMLRN